MKKSELPSPARDICQAFVSGLREILDTSLYGVYLYGATMFADSGPIQDIDCHVILERPLSDGEREEIFRLYEDLAGRFPPLGGEVDAYFILFEDARGTSPPRHQLRTGICDESWALHRSHIRAGHFLSLYGPDPTEIFPPASWQEISAALDHEMSYIEENLMYPAYCVLNLCRIIYSFQHRDVVVSKRFSGNWACGQFPEWAPLIQAAMRSYEGTGMPEDDGHLNAEMVRFLEFASERIREIRKVSALN